MPLSATDRAKLNQVISTVLTPADWEAIAAAGSAIEHHLKTVLSLPKTA